MRKALVAAGCLLLAFVAPATAAEDAKAASEHKFEKAAKYYAECKNASRKEFDEIRPYLKAFTDSEVMAETMNDPERFFRLMEIVNDPRTIHVMMNCSLEPVMWDTWMRGLTDFPKLWNASVKLMNPQGMVKWMMAPMNPKIWGSMMRHMEPQRYVRWASAFTNEDFYKPLTSFLDTDWYEPRLAWFVDPQSYAPLYQALQVPGLSAPAESGTDTKAETRND